MQVMFPNDVYGISRTPARAAMKLAGVTDKKKGIASHFSVQGHLMANASMMIDRAAIDFHAEEIKVLTLFAVDVT